LIRQTLDLINNLNNREFIKNKYIDIKNQMNFLSFREQLYEWTLESDEAVQKFI